MFMYFIMLWRDAEVVQMLPSKSRFYSVRVCILRVCIYGYINYGEQFKRQTAEGAQAPQTDLPGGGAGPRQNHSVDKQRSIDTPPVWGMQGFGLQPLL